MGNLTTAITKTILETSFRLSLNNLCPYGLKRTETKQNKNNSNNKIQRKKDKTALTANICSNLSLKLPHSKPILL